VRTKHEQTETPPATETVKLIRQARPATTKRYSAEDKIRIGTTLRHLGAEPGQRDHRGGRLARSATPAAA
jgi:hypothetical protein